MMADQIDLLTKVVASGKHLVGLLPPNSAFCAWPSFSILEPDVVWVDLIGHLHVIADELLIPNYTAFFSRMLNDPDLIKGDKLRALLVAYASQLRKHDDWRKVKVGNWPL